MPCKLWNTKEQSNVSNDSKDGGKCQGTVNVLFEKAGKKEAAKVRQKEQEIFLVGQNCMVLKGQIFVFLSSNPTGIYPVWTQCLLKVRME